MKTEFYVAVSGFIKDFTQDVQRHLNDGWELHGPMLVTVNSTMLQAMVRKTP